MDTSSFDNVFKTIEECFMRLQLSQSWVIKKVKTPEMVVIYRSTAVTQQLVDFQQQLASETQHDDYKPLLPEVKTEKDFDILPNNSVTDSRDANNLFREVEKKESEVVCTDPQAFNEPVLSIEENQNGDTISQRTSLITRKRTLEESQPRSLPQKKCQRRVKIRIQILNAHFLLNYGANLQKRRKMMTLISIMMKLFYKQSMKQLRIDLVVGH